MKSWKDIISSYKAMVQILDRKDANSTSGTDNNTGLGTDNTSGTRDANGTSSTNNSFDGKNTHIKVCFNTFNFVKANANADVGVNASNTINMRDTDSTDGINNNIDV